MKKLKFTEKIALRFLQKRFSSSMHIMLDKDGGWNISLRKNYRVWIPIEPELAYELCLINNVNTKTFKKGEERQIAKYVTAVV